MVLSIDIGAKAEPQMVEQLDIAARAQNRTRAEIIRLAIEAYLSKGSTISPKLIEAERNAAEGLYAGVLADLDGADEDWGDDPEDWELSDDRRPPAWVIEKIATELATTRQETEEERDAYALEQARDRRKRSGDVVEDEYEKIWPAGRAVAEMCARVLRRAGTERDYAAELAAERQRQADERRRRAEEVQRRQALETVLLCDRLPDALLDVMQPGVVYSYASPEFTAVTQREWAAVGLSGVPDKSYHHQVIQYLIGDGRILDPGDSKPRKLVRA